MKLLRTILLGVACAFALADPALASPVPEADHVRVQCVALRLNLNGVSLRHQIKLVVEASSSDETRLASVAEALLTVINPAGKVVNLAAREYQLSPKQFKAAHARLLFKAVEDSDSKSLTNVPPNFFSAPGPYQLQLKLLGRDLSGSISFGEPLDMRVEQEGQAARTFSLKQEQPFSLLTTPAEFGPVYFKRQDPTNFVFQMANMDQSIASGDYHPPIESPKYIFQVRCGDGEGGPTELVDPSRYIQGYAAHLIRGDKVSTPLVFPAGEFAVGDVLLVDFMRQEELPPDAGFGEGEKNFSSQVVIQERFIYALNVEAAPSSKELGTQAAVPSAAPPT